MYQGWRIRWRKTRMVRNQIWEKKLIVSPVRFGLLESFAGVAEIDVVERRPGHFDGRDLYAGGFEGDEHGRNGSGSMFGAGMNGFGGDLHVPQNAACFARLR